MSYTKEVLEKDLKLVNRILEKRDVIFASDLDIILENLETDFVEKVNEDSKCHAKIKKMAMSMPNINVYTTKTSEGLLVGGMDNNDAIAGKFILQQLSESLENEIENIKEEEQNQDYYDYDEAYDDVDEEDDYDIRDFINIMVDFRI